MQCIDDSTAKKVMYLRLTGEFSFREIGEILGKDETWARVTFYRDVGSAFTLGSELPGPDSQTGVTHTVTIEFADKTVQFINGRLVESPL